MTSDRQTGSRPDRRLPSGRLRAILLLFAVSAGTSLLAASPALAQTGYTGVPVPPPGGDTYVGPVNSYPGLGTSSVVAARLPAPPQGSSPAFMTVASPGLGDPKALDQGRGKLVTGRDLVSLGAVGLIAVVAFAASAGRFRSR